MGWWGLWMVVGCGGSPEPPPPQLIRRLTRVEYDHTVAALFHTRLRPGERWLPVDASSNLGFDNQADLLTLSPVLVEQYERAADWLIDDLFRVREETRYTLSAPANGPLVTATGGELGSRGHVFVGPGSLSTTFSVRHDGVHRLSVQAFGGGSGTVPVRILVEHDGALLGVFGVPEEEVIPIEVERYFPEGPATVTVHYANPPPRADGEARRRLVVRGLELEGPLEPEQGLRHDYAEVVPCDDTAGPQGDACATDTLEQFAAEAWRRPLTDDDRQDLRAAYDEARGLGLSWAEAVGHAMKVVLMSPEFLFRVERPAAEPGDALDAHELAVRLAYFLWRAPPDDELRAVADDGSLLDDEVLEAQTLRLLEHPRAAAMLDDLAAQWFRVGGFADLQLDPDRYPGMDDALRVSLADEIVRNVVHSMTGSRSMLDLVTPRERWIDERLAEHYGVTLDPGAEGEDGWHAVPPRGLGRQGFVDSVSVLSLTSLYDHPSAVRRARYLLDTLLCEPVLDPPPGVDEVLAAVDPEDYDNVRAYEEAVRNGASCQECHATMDPLGFALHGYGASGLPRTTDRWDAPIDATATLADGTGVSGAGDVTQWLREDPRLPRCIVQQTVAWAVGRAPAGSDHAAIDALTERFRRPRLRLRRPAERHRDDAHVPSGLAGPGGTMSSRTFTRRALLATAGASVALPFLPSVAPAGSAEVPRRLLLWFRPNGESRISVPDGSTLEELPAGMTPLAAIADRTTLISGLANYQGEFAAGDRHLATASTVLRGGPPINGNDGVVTNAWSVDQVVARAAPAMTPLSSLQLGVESFGSRVGGAVSYAAADQPLAPIVDPRAVFDRMFQGTDPTLSAKEAAQRAVLRSSVLDRVVERTNRLSRRLSAADAQRLDQYLTGVRELEARIGSFDELACEVPEAPSTPPALPERHAAMRDLMVLAFECDLTRTITFMAGRGGSQLRYPHLALDERPGIGHHDLGHHNNVERYIDELAVVQRWLVEQYAVLAERLAAIPDGVGGDLLEHTAMAMVTDWGDSNGHTARGLTLAVTGGEQGGWSHGTHQVLPYRPHTWLLGTIADFFGVDGDMIVGAADRVVLG